MNNPHKNARTCFYSREQIVEEGHKVDGSSAAYFPLDMSFFVREVPEALGVDSSR